MNLFNWLTRYGLGSPTMAVYTLERLRTQWLFNPRGWMPQQSPLGTEGRPAVHPESCWSSVHTGQLKELGSSVSKWQRQQWQQQSRYTYQQEPKQAVYIAVALGYPLQVEGMALLLMTPCTSETGAREAWAGPDLNTRPSRTNFHSIRRSHGGF